MWEPQVRALPGADVAAPVLYGLGSTYDEQAQALLEQFGDDELVPVGAGMGGFCAIALAGRAPDRIPGLVLVGTNGGADSPERRAGRDELIELLRSDGTERLWDELQADLFPDGAAPHVVERAREIALEQDPDQLLDALHAMRDRAALGGAFTGALLVAVGDRDPLVPLDEAGELARSAPGGRLEVFAGAGHLPSLEQPERFTPVLTDFLSPWL